MKCNQLQLLQLYKNVLGYIDSSSESVKSFANSRGKIYRIHILMKGNINKCADFFKYNKDPLRLFLKQIGSVAYKQDKLLLQK